MTEQLLGFIGLGNMGGPMAVNLAAAGNPLICYDASGTAERAPEGAIHAASSAEVAAKAAIVFLCLPDGPIANEVAAELMAAPDSIVEVVVDATTSGASEARATHDMLAKSGIAYADAPVSGGASGARAGTLAMMVAAPDDLFARLQPLLLPMAKNARHVGREPGQGMAMKLLNNFLSGMAMAATSEAMAFGASQGLDMATIVDTISVSSGKNTAITDKFPNRIIPESYDSGFATRLMTKDLKLYVETCKQQNAPHRLSDTLLQQVWGQMFEKMPDSDFTEVYPFTLGRNS
ncbi:MAG TPA: NAD(P)-dependent oxidoreductase [Alphaproteobacteria bacterium]|nr:NAD(P)-dependent oxidoreductase [Alphaproteobacteria bacterium]